MSKAKAKASPLGVADLAEVELIHEHAKASSAESGAGTSEFKAAVGAAAATTLALGVGLGVPLTPTQQTLLLTAIGSWTTLAALYGLGRGIRKRGTPGTEPPKN